MPPVFEGDSGINKYGWDLRDINSWLGSDDGFSIIPIYIILGIRSGRNLSCHSIVEVITVIYM